jgi:hypothetical protein
MAGGGGGYPIILGGLGIEFPMGCFLIHHRGDAGIPGGVVLEDSVWSRDRALDGIV